MTIKTNLDELRKANKDFLYHVYAELMNDAGGITPSLIKEHGSDFGKTPLEIGFTVNGVNLPFQIFNDLENKLDVYIEKEALEILRRYGIEEAIKTSYYTASSLLELAGRLGIEIDDYEGMLSEHFKERINLKTNY